MKFHLVYSRAQQAGRTEYFLQVVDFVVGNADGIGGAFVEDFLHGVPGIQPALSVVNTGTRTCRVVALAAWARPVNQQQINVGCVQLLQYSLHNQDRSRAMVMDEQACCTRQWTVQPAAFVHTMVASRCISIPFYQLMHLAYLLFSYANV